MRAIRRLWEWSVWHPAAIKPHDHKHRWKPRLWLPLYLACVMNAATGVIRHGTPVLDRALSSATVEMLGIALLASAAAALIGVTFPAMRVLEMTGLLILLGMIGSYATALMLTAESASSRDFLAWLIVGGIWLPVSRLTTIGEEIKEDREEQHVP